MDFDRITDSSVRKIFESLIQSKILINMHLTGTRYEQLTVMTGLRRKLGRLHFLLGYPDGFAEAAAGAKAWSVDYEFTGTDGIPYRFLFQFFLALLPRRQMPIVCRTPPVPSSVLKIY